MEAISVVLKLVDQLTSPAKKAKEALTGIKEAAEGVVASAKQATAATASVTRATENTVRAATAATRAARGLTAQQFGLGRSVVTIQRRFRAALPELREHGYMLGLSMRGVALGVQDAAATSLRLGRTAWEMGKRIAAAAGISIAGIVAIGRSYATALDSQGKFARQIGMSVQALRELGFVAERQGIPLETLNNGLEAFQKRLGELKMRRGGLDKLLGRVDPKLRGRLRAEKDPTKSFDMVIEAMSRMKDPAKRMVLAQAAFGEAGAEFVRLAMLGAEGIAKMREEARRLRGELGEGAVEDAERFNDAIDNIMDALRGLRDKVAGTILPIITPIIQAIEAAVVANRDIISAGVADAVSAISKAVREFDWAKFAENIRTIADVVKMAASAVGGFGNLLIGLAAAPFLPAIKSIVTGVIGTIFFLIKTGLRLRTVFGGLGQVIARSAALSVPAFGRLGRAARGAGADLLAFGKKAGSLRRMLAFGGLLSLGAMIFDDIGKTQQQRLEEMRANWAWWDELEQKLQNTAAGKWWQAIVDKVQAWKADVINGFTSIGTELVAVGKGWIDNIETGFKTGWDKFVAWLKGRVDAIKAMMPALPDWFGGDKPSETVPAEGGGSGTTTGGLPPPKSMADVVNNVDQSRQTQQTIAVTNNTTINATTSASPASIGATVAGAAEKGTRRALGGLHDGGFVGSTYLAGP